MVNFIEGTGKYGVEVKYKDGGKTTFFYSDKTIRDINFKRIKNEVAPGDKVKKKDR